MPTSRGFADNTVYEPPGVVPDYGQSSDAALSNHEHPLLDQGKVITLESPWENLVATPAQIYKSADWCLLEGVIWTNGTAVSDASTLVAVLDLEYRPELEHWFQNSVIIDGPVVAFDGDLRVTTSGQIIMESSSTGTNAVDRLFLHGINWRIS